MLDQLPAFLAAVLGAALQYEMVLLVSFVFILNVRRALRRRVEVIE